MSVPGGRPRVGRVVATIGGAAVVMAVAIALSRVIGFGRVLVFSKTVGHTCLGDVYNTANLLPNVAFEVVAGGALASVVVPVLVAPLTRGDRRQAGEVLSALVCWTLVVLVPAAILLAVFAGPIMGLFLDNSGCGTKAVAVGARMLRIFAPQVPMYGLAVVVGGALQAQRSYLPSTAAPIVSSLIMIPAYLGFAALASGDTPLGELPADAELMLSLGTTLGVGGLAVATVAPAFRRRVRLPWTVTLHFPPGVARQARALAAAGLAAFLAQQASALVVTWLANRQGTTGAFTLYTWAWQLYLLPYAVLAVPLATSAFQRLAAHAAAGDDTAYATTAARSTRVVIAATAGGAAVLAAAAVPLARAFVLGPGAGDASPLARGLVAFAPGLLGYALIAHLSRALYATHDGRRAAIATVVGWLVVIGADLVLVKALPADAAVAALGWGNTIGMTVAGTLLVAAVAAAAGRPALAGLPRTVLAAGSAAVVAGAAGYTVAQHAATAPFWAAIVIAGAVAAGAGAVYVLILAVADRPTWRELTASARTLLHRSAPTSDASTGA